MIASTRGNRHEDLVNAVSAVIAMLATELRGAEAWISVYKNWSEGRRVGGGYYVIDTDSVRPRPSPGYNFASESMVAVTLPPPICHEPMRGTRRNGDQVILDMTKAQAVERLRRPGPWRDVNPELVRELGIEEDA